MGRKAQDAGVGVAQERMEWGLRRLLRRETLQQGAALAVFSVAYAVAFRFGMQFSQTTASPFWFPDSVLLCALLWARPRWSWWLVAATLPIRLLIAYPATVPLWFLVFTTAIDAAKGLIAAAVLRRLLANPLRFESLRDYCLYALAVAGIVPALSAIPGAWGRHLLGYPFGASWLQWYQGDALTSLVITPFLFYWLLPPPRVRSVSRMRIAEALLIIGGLTVSTWLAFAPAQGRVFFSDAQLYAPVPFLVWAALRFGALGASGAIALLAIFAVRGALSSAGPFLGNSPAEVALSLQEYLLIRAVPLYVVGVLVDQTGRAAASLRESEARYREMVEMQTSFVCRLRSDMTLTFVNPAFCQFVGRAAADLVGGNFLALLPRASQSRALEIFGVAAASNEVREWESDIVLAPERLGLVHWTCRALFDAAGQLQSYQIIGNDVMDRKRAEEADRKVAHAARLAALGELTAMVAHELTQPLTAIVGNAEAAESLLQSEHPPIAELRQCMLDISADGMRASESIQEIRALTHKHEPNRVAIDLNAAVENVLRLASGDALRRRVQVRRDLMPELPSVIADSASLEHVLLNLVVNAMDAMSDTAEGERQLMVATSRDAESNLIVSVSDRGRGIKVADLPRLFDSFFTTKTGGMGLGLSIARSIVLAHGGRIWAENNPSGGASFHFTMRPGPM